jgi:class 3 adenylate cyclase/tetratricopeptide (TPR) repeat protein
VGEESALSAVACPRCGHENPATSRFCGSCGASLVDARPATEERKLVSVLFVDLVDFTARSDRADPEDVRDALRLYHGEAKRRIEEHGGTLEKFIGDAVMAVFGAPVAHGDDAERAVRAGLSVLEGVAALLPRHGLELAARAAVDTGEAVVTVGREPSGDALAMGDVVNTASRLQSAAPAGRLIVGPETYRATRYAIRYEHLAPVTAKGKSEPLAAWLAVEPSLSPAERPTGLAPLVGRTRELELIGSLWRRALAERRPHLITLLGPPGIGKSRLCREVAETVAADGGRTLHGRCLPYGERTGYQAFSHLVRGAAGILETDAPGTARTKLQQLVDGVVPVAEAEDTGRYLSLLLGLGTDDAVNEPRRLFYAARRFAENAGLAAPTLLVFEDIHWAESSELELLEYLAKHVRETPVVLVALARPELLDGHPGWGGGVAQTTIPLDPLDAGDAERLAAHVLAAAATRPVDLARLVETAEGNPLFVEELAASVIELGEAERLPVTVREAIAARIDALPVDARAALLAAAVVGKTFWRGALKAVGGVADVDEALYALEARDVVRREPTSQIAGDTEFSFKHMLVREVAYATVPRAERRRRHDAVARHIEDTLEHASELLAPALAHHWREAGEPERAIPYLLAAAERALDGWARGAVVGLLDEALALAEDDALRRRIQLVRGDALLQLGELEQAADVLAELLPELEGRERLEALLTRGRATHWLERDAETLRIADEAVALATALGADDLLPAALALQAEAHAQRGGEGDLDRAVEQGERAIALWPPGVRTYDLADHMHLQADVSYWTGEYARSVELGRASRELGGDVHSAHGLLRGGGMEALALCGLGRHEEAIRIWDELFALARDILDRRSAVLLNYSSLAYRELFDLDEARRRSGEALELAAGATFSMYGWFARSDLVLTDILAGEVGRAQAAWPGLWEGAGNSTAWTTWLIYGRLAAARAEIALRAEAPDSAVEWARKAAEIAHRTRRRKYEARSRSVLGEALARLGKREDALAALEAGVELADTLVGAPARWEARAALGRAAYALGDDDRAAAAYGEAAELIVGFAATLAPERAERLLAAPPIEELRRAAGRGVAGR